ncbi:MAG: GIY-YIG nuclease family protein [Chitinophagales bacterium]|nr:GIY-YIG nuclease family protein [Chitinophagales bacterium]
MPYTVYIVYSANIDQYYIGQTENLPDRLFRHRNSGSLATKKIASPFTCKNQTSILSGNHRLCPDFFCLC